MKTDTTHYDTLMVARDAPLEVIRAAYRALSQRHHPDRNEGDAESTQLMQAINEAYAALSDPARRRAYDVWLAEQEHGASTAVITLGFSPGERPRRAALSFAYLSSAALGCTMSILLVTAIAAYCFPDRLHSAVAYAYWVAHGSASATPSSFERHALQSGTITRADTLEGEAAIPAVAQASTQSTLPEHPTAPARAVAHPPGRPAKRGGLRANVGRASTPRAAGSLSDRAVRADDLEDVRKQDPAAAVLISSYCKIAAKHTTDPNAGAATCRRNEALAWKHFVVSSNWSFLYEEMRPKCTQAPFPDSYEAKEACVKYELTMHSRTD